VTRASLLSFDIDGTLEIGDPPGIIPIALVRRAKNLGYLVGSCSDRPISFQDAMWQRLGLVADFTVLKHRLGELRARFAARRYYHIGDTDVDALRDARGLSLPARRRARSPRVGPGAVSGLTTASRA
jgi:hypothetical protein